MPRRARWIPTVDPQTKKRGTISPAFFLCRITVCGLYIEYRVKYRTRANRIRRRIVFVLLALALIGIVVLVHFNITGVLKSIAEANMRSITTVAVNDAIYYTLSDGIRYEDLIVIERDEAGEIRSLTSNVFQINRIARDAAYMSQQNLTSMSESGIEIPLGAFTGI